MATAVTQNATIKKSVTITPQYYRELIEKASSYNSRLSSERRLRLPFIDSQTGLAQNHSTLWHPYRSRGPGEHGGQIYSYPAKRWKKKKRSFPLPEVRLTKLSDVETGDAGTYMHQISAVENPAAIKEDSRDQFEETPYKEPYSYQYYDDWDTIEEPLDAGEIDTRHSDSSDFEDTYIKKKKKKGKVSRDPKSKGGRGRKKDQEGRDDIDKPFSCEQCGARYKTRPGLSYHVNHSHSNAKKKEPSSTFRDQSRDQSHERDQSRSSTEFSTQIGFDEEPGSPHLDDSLNGVPGKTRSTGRSSTQVAAPAGPATPSSQSGVSKYCDFCLGDATENKKTGTREDLVSCADCGRSGHPSCLQFTANMIISVKKYPWQCIECKSCGLCGTSDNDDQLLFCDDCDRGYHMYCLKPPLSEPPEGSWSCHLCIDEFYDGKKPDNGQADTLSL